MKQGAALKTTYTQNVGKNFNVAVEYMGHDVLKVFTKEN